MPSPINPNELFLIAGPCVIESRDICLRIAESVQKTCDHLKIQYIFKASFDKANRSAGSSFRGPGLVKGLKILSDVKKKFGLPLLTDIHEAQQAAPAAEIVDVLQIPAFLARQTDLLQACAKTGKTLNIKKGQFMSPQEMGNALAKAQAARPKAKPGDFWLCERGTFFGYNRLVNDFTSLSIMKSLGAPVVFDITHSTQQPAGQGNQSGGNPQFAPLLACAAIATGCVNGLFLECHPTPKEAKSDAATMLDLADVPELLRQVRAIYDTVSEWR